MPAKPTQLALTRQPDPVLAQTGGYTFSPEELQYFDTRIRAIQVYLAELALNGILGTYYTVDGASAALIEGDIVCLASSGTGAPTVTKAVAAALAIAGAVEGIVLTAAGPGGAVKVAVFGVLKPSITGLATGSAGFVRANTTTARCERVAAFGSSDYPIGSVDSQGYLSIQRGAKLGVVPALGSTTVECRGATTTNDTLSGLGARDGITPLAGQTWLVTGQSSPAANGIYTTAAGAWSRHTDFNTAAEFVPGQLVVVTEGTDHGDTIWELSTGTVATLDVSLIGYEKVGAPLRSTAQPNTAVLRNANAASGFTDVFLGHPDIGEGGGSLYVRKTDNTADIPVISTESGDLISYGTTAINGHTFNAATGSLYNWTINGVGQVTIGTGYIAVGAGTRADAGQLRTIATGGMQARGDGAYNVPLIKHSTGDLVEVGDDTRTTAIVLRAKSGGGVQGKVNNIDVWSLEDGFITAGGGTVAGTGLFRGANNRVLLAARGSGSFDVEAVKVDSSDQVIVGESTDAAAVLASVKTGGFFGVLVNGAEVSRLDASGMLIPAAAASWDFRWVQDASAAGAGTSFYGQRGAASFAGGTMAIGGGAPGTANTNLGGDLTLETWESVANTTAKVKLNRGASGVYLQMYMLSGNTTIEALTVPLKLVSPGSFGLDSGGTGTFLWNNGGNGLGRTDVVNPVGASSVSWASGVTSVTYTQADKTTNGAAGAKTTIRAQNETGTTSTGGELSLESGSGTAADGAVTIKANATTRIQANGTGLGFFATAPVAKPTVTGSRGGNAALASLLTALANLGLITDSTTA